MTSRDNLQVIADLMNLKAALHNSLDANGRVILNSDGINMVILWAVWLRQPYRFRGYKMSTIASTILDSGAGIGGIIMNSMVGKDEVPPILNFPQNT